MSKSGNMSPSIEEKTGQNGSPEVATNSSLKAQPEQTSSTLTSFFSDIISNFVMGGPFNKTPSKADNATSNIQQNKKSQDSINDHQAPLSQASQPSQQQTLPTPPKKACRAPLSKKFAHPCTCNSSNYYKTNQLDASLNSTGSLPPAAYTVPLHLYDPASRKCLPTSRVRDMLLKECRSNVASPYPLPHQLYHGAPCVYEDLVCDARRNRCVCKPSLHLYYESNSSAFGCVPIGPSQSSDGRTNCRIGQIYNSHSKECQKIFDVNDLPPTYTTGVSATQFSFVTIVLIWILLLILIVTAKLRKLRNTNLYGSSPTSERRLHRGSGSYRHQSHSGASAWLHPFIAAVNGHHHLNQHRTTVDRHSQSIDNAGNYNDTDFFLANGARRLNDFLGTDGQFTGSQQSINNPPPKFEEIYPTACQEERVRIQLAPPSNEDLPTYDEAMKLENTKPPDVNHKE